MRAIAVALVLGGCYSPTAPALVPCGEGGACPSGQKCVAGLCGGSEVTDDADTPTPDMQMIDAAALCTTWDAHHFDACVIPAPQGDLTLTLALSGFNWDTDNGVLKGKANTTVPVVTSTFTQTAGPDLLFVSVNNFTLEAGANLTFSGARGVLIAVWGTATIAGDIDADASFNAAGAGGYAAQSTECVSGPTGNPGGTGPPPEGGGGGAYQGDGGRGGNAAGGAGQSIATPTFIHGGCAGGAGGTGGGTATRGAGGGAIQLSARVAIDVPSGGSLSAGGGAGRGGIFPIGGGGGGGAGGYLGLDAPTITIGGTLAANGGGGGGGASDVANGINGNNGATSGNEAAGGNGAGTTNIGACGRGGNGSAVGDLTGDIGGSSMCGGAGGGGGAGYILFWSASPTVLGTGTVSPSALAGPP